jgi:uncharacterized phage-like protein YoqJ
MPSGLTYKIYSGEDLTLRDFALRCVRQLGARYYASQQGDKDLPKDKAPILKVADYHPKKIEEAKADLQYYSGLLDNLEAAQKLYDEEYNANMKYNAETNEEREKLKERYEIVLKKVENWTIPEEYNSLKELMLKQLKESIDWDCSPYTPYKEEKIPVEEWVRSKIKMAVRDVEYHTEELRQETLRIEEYNNYLKGLYEALDKVEPLT